tara:strand:+ start:24651 stop:26165 length:1515 start_codon:yes stop_codon:yes gene_type:complete
MNTTIKKFLIIGSLLTLVACGGSGSSNTGVNVTSEPPPPPAAPPTAPAEPPAPTVVLTGVAAIGAALDGAVIEVIDAAGNLVDIGETATGTNGSYSVVLPADVALPVVIRATPPNGTPLLSIVQAPADGSTDIVANINPVTNLVSSSVLGTGSGSSESDIAGALATVDASTIGASGDEIINRVFGASVNYAAFASDPTFVANDGSGPGSAADAVLDTVAKRAAEAGVSVEETLTLFEEAETPPALLEDAGFQVELVSELIKGGTDSTTLESQLSGIGALDEAPTDGSPDVFRTILQVVPAIIETTRTNAAGVSGNTDLVNVAIDATVSVITKTIKTKKDRFAAQPGDVNNLLNSPSFQATTTKVVADAVIPMLMVANQSANPGSVLNAAKSVASNISQQASDVVSSFDFNQDSADVSNVVSGFVTQKVTGGQTITAETLQGITDGNIATTDVVTAAGDVSQVQQDVQNFAAENPTLVQGDISTVIQQIPTGSWDASSWNGFNWG